MWQRGVEENESGWMIRDATGNKFEWVSRAKGIAPNLGVTDSQAMVRATDLKVSGDERVFIEACEAVNVFHPSGWAMEYLEEIL